MCMVRKKNRHLQKSLPSKIITAYKMHTPLHIYMYFMHLLNKCVFRVFQVPSTYLWFQGCNSKQNKLLESLALMGRTFLKQSISRVCCDREAGLECHPRHQKVVSLVPGQVTYLGEILVIIIFLRHSHCDHVSG